MALAPDEGYAHVGPSGAGHFVKMVHNGIEYGLLAAYGEGFEILERSAFELDLDQIAGIWRYGSVVRSWLLELLHDALVNDPGLADIRGYVDDSGEGRWTLEAAIDENVPAPITALALFARFASRQDESFSAKVIAALRNEFGGHAVKTEKAGAWDVARRPAAPQAIVIFGASGDLTQAQAPARVLPPLPGGHAPGAVRDRGLRAHRVHRRRVPRARPRRP